jgi:hypothetical protein
MKLIGWHYPDYQILRLLCEPAVKDGFRDLFTSDVNKQLIADSDRDLVSVTIIEGNSLSSERSII